MTIDAAFTALQDAITPIGALLETPFPYDEEIAWLGEDGQIDASYENHRDCVGDFAGEGRTIVTVAVTRVGYSLNDHKALLSANSYAYTVLGEEDTETLPALRQALTDATGTDWLTGATYDEGVYSYWLENILVTTTINIETT